MTTKHTAGPWSHRNGRVFQTDYEALTIAKVARAHDGDYSPANGALIAAAPELLEACKVAFDQTCAAGRPKDWEQLRAAIAKATGGAA